MQWTVAILAGGQSSRMGQDKAELLIDGETLLMRTVKLAQRAGANQVLVVGRVRPACWSESDTQFIPDALEAVGSGPLGGLLTALENATAESVLLLACDMPALTVNALQWLIGATESEKQATVAVGPDGEPEPLFAVYRQGILPRVHERLASGRRSLKGLIESADCMLLPVPSEHYPALTNVNTPEELVAYIQQNRYAVE